MVLDSYHSLEASVCRRKNGGLFKSDSCAIFRYLCALNFCDVLSGLVSSDAFPIFCPGGSSDPRAQLRELFRQLEVETQALDKAVDPNADGANDLKSEVVSTTLCASPGSGRGSCTGDEQSVGSQESRGSDQWMDSGVFPSPILNMDSEAVSLPVLPGDAQPDEPFEETELGSIEQQKHVVLHLLSQLKLGMDLTKIVLPTFILEKRSILEMFADYLAHPDLFVNINRGEDPEARMIAFVQWYLTAFHAGRKPIRSNKLHRVSAEIYAPQAADASAIDRGASPTNLVARGGKKWSIDVNTLKIMRKHVRPIDKQRPEESRRLWQHVTNALKSGNLQLATEKKRELEERQRVSEKFRARHRIPFPVKYFQWDGTSWIFRRPDVAVGPS
ncbi:hypothetical protein X801_03625 [Opisthorchis viverrini]|uniref:Oxysterol-binding protein n=1 Tax=Opisthorchis viverrini TaxID=6198 RepID=A0A1S8X199_OPIVI|nr:hypothetical protein X801_03625 [Opisthorchis viverrini]